jgi:hypothetical protein
MPPFGPVYPALHTHWVETHVHLHHDKGAPRGVGEAAGDLKNKLSTVCGT